MKRSTFELGLSLSKFTHNLITDFRVYDRQESKKVFDWTELKMNSNGENFSWCSNLTFFVFFLFLS